MSRSELERIKWGPEPGQQVGGLGSVRVIARCPGNSNQVLGRAKEVLEVVCSAEPPSFVCPSDWSHVLPTWMTDQFHPEPSEEELTDYLSLPYEERLREENNSWTLAGWIHWFKPENRYWSWWDAVALDADTLVVAIEVMEWPFPWGALKWLLRAAGATSVREET